MRELPLTDKQIEICDKILKRNNEGDNFDYFDSLGYEQMDLKISVRYMFENKLMSVFGIIILTDLGLKYSNKGIIAFIKHKRFIDFLSSQKVISSAVWITILMALTFGILNYCKNQVKEETNIKQIEKNQPDTQLLASPDNAKDKKTVNESTIDTTEIFDNAINEKPK